MRCGELRLDGTWYKFGHNVSLTFLVKLYRSTLSVLINFFSPQPPSLKGNCVSVTTANKCNICMGQYTNFTYLLFYLLTSKLSFPDIDNLLKGFFFVCTLFWEFGYKRKGISPAETDYTGRLGKSG